MKVRENCRHFSWKKKFFIGSMNKVDQCFLIEPFCELGKLKFGSCPENCKWFENIE
ncbi:MAG: hypothetical protein J7L20_03180 [Thermoplasmata archaeon]|nr:hypothetical protein [Thermoplasmata archaeon]